MEPFTLVEESSKEGPYHLFDDVTHLTSAKTADHDLQYVAALRKAFPEMIVTTIPTPNTPLRAFAAAGLATCEVDKETDSYASWRGYAPPSLRSRQGGVGEAVDFAKYHYKFNDEDFILYTVRNVQYVLKEPRDGEHILGPSKATDFLIKTVGDYITSITDIVWVYDGYWQQNRSLYQQIMKSSWDKVILDEDQKTELTSVANRFFDSRETYEELGVPWKRGLIFHGPPGNGKTISIRALSHELYKRKDPVITLYVKSAQTTYDIGAVFRQARALAPCMLVLEDVETIVNAQTRSYFFNEMDGIESNDGLFVVASTNYLDKLDSGLTKRPSRFDRKYLFPLPNEHERTLYAEYWYRKLKPNTNVDFPKKLCQPMAHVTPGFSFAFMQECFVATMLALARKGEEKKAVVSFLRPYDPENSDGLDDYEIWVEFKAQAEILRKEIESQKTKKTSALSEWCRAGHLQEAGADEDPAQSKVAQHCRCCCRREERERERPSDDPLRMGLAGLTLKSEMLPKLSWYETKSEYLTPTAFETRL